MTGSEQTRRPSSVRWALVALAVALFIRVGYALSLPPQVRWPDGRTYVTVAENYNRGLGVVLEPGGREASKMPGYPLFLATFHPETDKAAFLITVRVVQSVIGAALCLLAWRLASRHFGQAAGVAAAYMAALYPFFIYYCGAVLSESVFMVLFGTGFLLLDIAEAAPGGSGLERRRIVAASAAGLVIGGATMFRASALLVLPFVLPWAILQRVLGRNRDENRFSGREMAAVLARFALAGLCMALVLFPWILRNQRKYDHFVPTTLQVGESLYEACSPYATGGPAWHLVPWAEEGGEATRTEFENDRYWRSKALTWIRQEPGRFVQLALVKLGRFWNLFPNSEDLRSPFLMIVSGFSYGPVMLLALYGLWTARRRLPAHLVMLAPVLYYTLLHMAFVGSIRYRTPIMLFVMVFSAHGLVRLSRVLVSRGPSRLP